MCLRTGFASAERVERARSGRWYGCLVGSRQESDSRRERLKTNSMNSQDVSVYASTDSRLGVECTQHIQRQIRNAENTIFRQIYLYKPSCIARQWDWNHCSLLDKPPPRRRVETDVILIRCTHESQNNQLAHSNLALSFRCLVAHLSCTPKMPSTTLFVECQKMRTPRSSRSFQFQISLKFAIAVLLSHLSDGAKRFSVFFSATSTAYFVAWLMFLAQPLKSLNKKRKCPQVG